MKQIIIVGGGASGMVAAIMAARNGAAVTVLERMQRVGKKLLATGNGRCNLTNCRLESRRYHGGNSGFLNRVFSQFGLEHTLAFFASLGIPVQEEENGKLFPFSQQASSVLDVLRYEMERLGVVEICDTSVHSIKCKRGRLRCVCGNDQPYDADRVIFCTGGKSAPNLGSNGGGYKLAQALGHTIIEPFPALVQVCLEADYLNQLAGVSLVARGQVHVENSMIGEETGEFLFAKYGISGTALLQLSRIISENTLLAQKTTLRLDLFPALSLEELTALLQARMQQEPYKSVSFFLVGLLHKRLIPVILHIASQKGPKTFDNLQQPCGELALPEIEQIAMALKTWDLPCTGTQSWMHSQVTAGGVDIHEVNPETLQSLQTPEVFFAGEVLDIDGDSGGFNLQWAWSTGAIAGRHAAIL